MPVVVRNAEQNFGFAAGKNHAIFKILAASVHVRMQAREFYVVANDKVGIDAIVGMAGRNFECAIGGGQGEDALFRWLLGKDDAEPRLIASGVTVRRVVHLKDNVRAGFDELGLTGTKNFGRLTGSVANEEIAGKGAGVRLLFCFDLRSSG